MLKQIENVKLPIIYISLSLVISSFCYGIYSSSLWLAVLSAGLFFIYVIFDTNIYFGIIIIIFFILQWMINYNYYNLSLGNNIEGEIKIVEKNGYYIICDYKGRNFNIEGNIASLNVGDRIYINGHFIEGINKEKGIIGLIKIEKSKKLDGGFISSLYELRKEIFLKLEENIGRRKAGLISSLSFGYTEYLDTEDKQEMKSLGIIHAISVSGLHVALVFLIINKFTEKTVSLGITVVYVLLTGAAFSAIRALIMIILLALSSKVKKKYNGMAALCLSAAILVIIKPYSIFNIGFILSYLATIGIILFSKKINNKIYKVPKYIRETIAIGISAQILTLPIIIVSFNEVSLTSMLGNLIIVPILNILIVLGNLLLPFILLPSLFDFISFILLKVINFLDYIMDLFFTISSKTYIANESIALIYGMAIISIFFIRKGYKKFYMLPIITLIMIMIYIYSPIPRIDYLREGGILISLKGDRKIITNKQNIDMEKLKKTTLANDGYRQGKQIILDNIKITASGKNFLLHIADKEYLLRLDKKEEKVNNYDIINFINGDTKGFYILGEEIIEY